MSILNKYRESRAKRAAYLRTVEEIEGMSLQTAWDLGLFREDAHKIAKTAVYGK